MRQLTLAALALIGCAAGAGAAERRVQVTSFERIRVEGPFQVTVATGRAPSATISGDARRLDGVEVRVDGRTLVVRATERGRDARGDDGPVAVTLATPTLAGAAVLGGGVVTVAGGRAARVDLSVAGAGGVAWSGADADQLNATLIGNGQITVAGRAVRARLLLNGAGRIAADALVANELVVRVDGPGETLGRARYTAAVSNSGLGRVSVAGSAKCVVHNAGGGAVRCGALK